MTPRVALDRTVTWCPECEVYEYANPDWAAAHHATTGHVTHQRSTVHRIWEATDEAK